MEDQSTKNIHRLTPTRSASVGVAVADPQDVQQSERAAALADELGLRYVSSTDGDADGYRFLLTVTDSRLELRELAARRARPLFVDFVSGPTGYRRHSGLTKRQAIARAVGIGKGITTVVDATAGLGRDSFLLACLGCEIIAVERSVVLAALLRDGLARAREVATDDSRLAVVVERMTLVAGDACQMLRRLSADEAPDTVYLDPMYPVEVKSALPKRELRICRALVGEDADAGALFEIARGVARRRVVVKRPPHANPLAESPTQTYTGRRVRYDMYTCA